LFDGFGICFGYDLIGGETTNETDVYENYVYRTTDDGMEADNYCSNVRIWKNVIHDTFVGISIAPAFIGPVFVIRNVIYNTGAPPNQAYGGKGPCCGTGFKFQHPEPKSGSGPIYLFHNTVIGGTQSYGIIVSEPAIFYKLVSRNNIWVGENRVALSIRTKQLIDFDYDVLWAGNYYAIAEWPEKGTRFNNLTSFASSTGLESNGVQINPGFINTHEDNYQLSPDSPLIDAGLRIQGINDDYFGLAPDIGAFESK